MQPFASTAPLGTSGGDGEGQTLFFAPNKTFDVSIYEDPGAFDARLTPALVDGGKGLKMLGKGTMTLGQGVFVDSVRLNEDAYEMKEGIEKFKAWKAEFEKIGRELE